MEKAILGLDIEQPASKAVYCAMDTLPPISGLFPTPQWKARIYTWDDCWVLLSPILPYDSLGIWYWNFLELVNVDEGIVLGLSNIFPAFQHVDSKKFRFDAPLQNQLFITTMRTVLP